MAILTILMATKALSSLKTFGFLVFLIFVIYLTHHSFMRVGLGLLNADFAVYPLTVEWIRLGHWYPFQAHYEYGGIILSLFRLPWSWLYSLFHTGDTFLDSHFSFGFYVVPFFLTVSFYYLARAYSSRVASALVAITCAIGFNCWTFNAGIEFYNSYLILGSILLGLRARFYNPFLEMSLVKLFLAAFLSGLAYYNCRASIVYIIAFFLPWEWFVLTIRSLFQPQDKIERALFWIALVFLALFLYFEAFGPDAGIIFGKRIKVHAQPNLKFALVAFGLIWLKRKKFRFDKSALLRAGVVAFGFIVGMLPEIVFWLSKGKIPPLTGNRSYSFGDSMRAFGKIPEAFVSLFAGSSDSFFKHASIALVLWAFVVLLKRARSDRSFHAVVFAGALSIIAYARVLTYDFAPPRYLIPLFPTLMVGLAVLFERVFAAYSRRKTLRALSYCILSIGLLLFHNYGQLSTRSRISNEIIASGLGAKISGIVDTFRKENVSVVLTNDYWYGNQYTVAARLNPVFIPVGSPFIIPELAAKASGASKVGIILSGLTGNVQRTRSVKLGGSDFDLQPLKQIGDVGLFIGKAK